jgi:hypothetical protein
MARLAVTGNAILDSIILNFLSRNLIPAWLGKAGLYRLYTCIPLTLAITFRELIFSKN